MKNTPSHIANDCKAHINYRKKQIKDIETIYERYGLRKEKNLIEFLLAIFFTIEVKNKKKRKKLVEIVKDTIVHQITNDKSKSRLEFFEEASVKEETDSEVSEKMNYIKTKN